jgi:hypothetical protein
LYRSLLAANVHIDLNTLLFGSQIYNIDTNRHVFITVQTYIKETNEKKKKKKKIKKGVGLLKRGKPMSCHKERGT